MRKTLRIDSRHVPNYLVPAASDRVADTFVSRFYAGLEINPERPHSKLPYRGAW